MVLPGDRPPPWSRHELDALARLDRARLCLDAVLIGDWPADAEITEALAALVDSATPHLRLAAAYRRVA